jgi:hypothetical protein
MAKLSLALAAGVAIVGTALFAPSLAARAQSPRFEYLHLRPYGVIPPSVPQPGVIRVERPAYRACVATTPEWTCRPFEPDANTSVNSDDALRLALLTLGNEGWEMVSAVDDTRDDALTYLFKRQR